MSTGQLLADELLPPQAPAHGGHPTDSSRVLLGLMSLARRSEVLDQGPDANNPLGGVIERGVLRSLLTALHFRDVATVRHCRRTAIIAAGVARQLGWTARQLNLIEVAALLHDIGKVGVPDNILFKPGRLSVDEAELMALHYHIGVDVLQACRVDSEVLTIISQAHSHYDAETDTYRKLGGDVHQGARILAVSDAYDSLSTNQAYREAKPHEEILRILSAPNAQFDSNLVLALASWIEAEGRPLLRSAEEALPGTPQNPDQQTTAEASSLCHIFSYLYVLENLYDGFYLVDSDLRFVVWNRGVERLLGRPAGEMLRRSWSSRLLCHANAEGSPLPDEEYPLKRVLASGKSTTTSVQLQRADGRWISVETQSVPLLDRSGRLHGVAEIFRDASRTSAKPREYRELKLAATRDPLTSVANRGEMETQLARMLGDFAQRDNPEPLSVIFLDLDFFKSINDTWGHTVGDQVLVEVAQTLQQETYSGELIARYGGEEFVILCPDTELEQAVRRADRLRQALEKTQIAGLKDRRITASFGVASAEAGDSTESLLHRADKAMYNAKRSGRNATCHLTVRELSGERGGSGDTENQSSDPMVYKTTFRAVIAADMIVYKLGGFVSDQKARLKDVSPNRAVLRIGSRGLLPFWGSDDEGRPVELQMQFTEVDAQSIGARKKACKEVEVDVCVRPLGWCRHSEVFQSRAKRVIKILRSYFVVG